MRVLRGARCGSSARRDLRGGHRANGVPTSICKEMKTFCKYFLAFALGAALSAFAISIFIPGTVRRDIGFVGSSDPRWTLDAFETINSELPQLVDNSYLKFTVVPGNSGRSYNVVGFDTRLIARFGFTKWDDSLDRIDARMDALSIENNKQNKAEMATPRNPSD